VQLLVPLADAHIYHLPDHVRERWALWEDSGIAGEGIEAKREAATKRREVRNWWSTTRCTYNRSLSHV
jgi:hypothetical protein